MIYNVYIHVHPGILIMLIAVIFMEYIDMEVS